MIHRYSVPILLCGLMLTASCARTAAPDAYGIVDAHSWMVASSESGQIVDLRAEEGRPLAQDVLAFRLDTGALSLQLRAYEAQIRALRPTLPDVGRQLDVLHSQKESLENEKARVDALVSSGSASTRQAEDLADKIRVVDSQIAASRSSLSRETASVLASIESLKSQADIIRDRIGRCSVKNPENGTVTTLYAHLHEFVAAGHPVYKLSDLEHLYVDAWLDGAALSRVALGDAVEVCVDAADGDLRTVSGRITYIAQEAEFTPNKVLTRDTRTRQVYHVRIDLDADGMLRPGMPAEIHLSAR
ncbi:MAG: HlyD family efflux transporter periplasmic adaptor subunit [Bacteroidales bacterium]|nr:HlyD family efflux transporter periplasmic adaptor subunit [Bacteroidales bacterium]